MVVRDLFQCITFGEGVDEIAVSANPTAQIAQDPARVMRMISQHTVIDRHIVQG